MRTATTRNPIAVFGTTFQNPVLLAAGTAGFGRELAGVMALDRLGGLVTKAVSPEPRSGNRPPRVGEFETGMVNAIGLANPGLEQVATRELPWLGEHLGRARVIVNVVGNAVSDYVRVVDGLSSISVPVAFEINVSCPNTEQGGQEFGADDRILAALTSKVRGATTLPVIVKLAPNLPNLPRTVAVVEQAGADGLTLVNTLPSDEHGEPSRLAGARLGFGRGGVSGPALLPMGIQATETARKVTALPVIGAGGVRTFGDMKRYLDAGASLVAVGTAALADPRVPRRLVDAWEADG